MHWWQTDGLGTTQTTLKSDMGMMTILSWQMLVDTPFEHWIRRVCGFSPLKNSDLIRNMEPSLEFMEKYSVYKNTKQWDRKSLHFKRGFKNNLIELVIGRWLCVGNYRNRKERLSRDSALECFRSHKQFAGCSNSTVGTNSRQTSPVSFFYQTKILKINL